MLKGKFGLWEIGEAIVSVQKMFLKIFDNFKIFSKHTHDGNNSLPIPSASVVKEKYLIDEWIHEGDTFRRALRLDRHIEDCIMNFYVVDLRGDNYQLVSKIYPQVRVVDVHTIQIYVGKDRPILMIVG